MSVRQGLDMEDDAYHSSSDSDFADEDSASSGEEGSIDGDEHPAPGHDKSKALHKDADGDLEMGSGDEGIIAEGKRYKASRKGEQQKKSKQKQKKKRRLKHGTLGNGDGQDPPNDVLDDQDSDNAPDKDGIRVRLRSGRGGDEDATRARVSKVSTSTVDIEAIWARMNDPARAQASTVHSKGPDTDSKQDGAEISLEERSALKELAPSGQTSSGPRTITIPHTYTFAGETHTSSKVVPADSPEAIAYLESAAKSTDENSILSQGPTLRRPLARKNLLEPNPTASIDGVPSKPRLDLPPSIGGKGARQITHSNENATTGIESASRKKKDITLNTVEKSKLDWEREVERQGLREELQKAEKSGDNYLGRMEFLNRADSVREEEARRRRLAGMT